MAKKADLKTPMSPLELARKGEKQCGQSGCPYAAVAESAMCSKGCHEGEAVRRLERRKKKK